MNVRSGVIATGDRVWWGDWVMVPAWEKGHTQKGIVIGIETRGRAGTYFRVVREGEGKPGHEWHSSEVYRLAWRGTVNE